MHQAQLLRSKGFLACCVYYTRNMLYDKHYAYREISEEKNKLWPTSRENLTPATYSRDRKRKMAMIYFSTAVLLIK